MSTALSAEETADALRSPTPSDPSWLRLILAGGPVLALLGGVVGLVLSPVVSAGYVVAGVVLPAVIVTLLVGSRGRRSLFAVAALLNAEAVLAGALLPAGIAVAIVMPMISVALVQEQLSPRAHLRASVAAGVVTTLGVALAVLVGPASVLFTGTATAVTILSFTALVTFALALDWRVTHRLRTARATRPKPPSRPASGPSSSSSRRATCSRRSSRRRRWRSRRSPSTAP